MRHGFLLIDKPLGFTSHDAVAKVRKILGERSVGHLGTLDPAATGLLVLAIGKKALKVVELFGDLTKEYEADVAFGATSTTYDREGVIEEQKPKPGWEVPEAGTVQRLIADRFIGKVSQVPPAYSAISVGGERAYRKMRQGRPVNLPPRDVEIHRCDIISYDFPNLKLDVECGSGTYIRSLANDLGELLGCGGYLSALKRTKVGDWKLDDAHEPDDVAWGHVIPLKEVLSPFHQIELTNDEFEDVTHGRPIERDIQPSTFGWYEDLPVVLLKPAGEGYAAVKKLL